MSLGTAPLYTRFVDVWDAVDRFRALLEDGGWADYPEERARVTCRCTSAEVHGHE